VPVPRRFDRRPPERDTTRINERIRVPQVRLIGADGEQLGIVDTSEALRRAQEADLDLVEVAANSKPPVTRMLDYSKYKYEQEQKQKQARKHQQQVNIREIKLRPKIATHDYDTKKGHVERFLKHGDKVKITIMFRGREQAHPERGRALLQKLFEDLGGLAVIESAPLQEGRNMSMLLAPSKEARAAEEAAAALAAGEADSAVAAVAEADADSTPAAAAEADADSTPAAAAEADGTPPAAADSTPSAAEDTTPAEADSTPAAAAEDTTSAAADTADTAPAAADSNPAES
jgi:translation initiation factor IF-3